MAIAIGIAVVAVLAAAGAINAWLAAKKKLSSETARFERETAAFRDGMNTMSAEKAEQSAKIETLEATLAELEGKLAELSSAADKSKREQTTQRQFFARKARDTFELLKQRLAADGLSDKIEAFTSGGPAKSLSEEAKRLVKETESWMEQAGSEDPNILHTLGVVDFATGDVKKAELRLRAATRTSSDVLLQENLGDLMRATGRSRRAIESYKNAAKNAKDDATVHRKLGLALFSTGDYAAAVKPLTLAIHADPKNLDLHLKTARALIESGDFQRAVDLTQSTAKRFPKSPELPACAVIAFARMKR
ncbi:MAG TPA: tetratricopeptide repeat protein, partial [Thermoanaerobaculia bacterium]|nr:tetratricopeptide repeat protein [Thermoanaerobaculia bacterium]